MSSPGQAVFLSYASQDAEAAKRIAEALRAAGVEVWFDQNELVGGDQWDSKIRGQISSCTLFMPVISANTQARLEGYFRLEWKLAAQRTHTMADEVTFLMPVLIDGTRDAEAKVPGEFRAVQWTKLAGGEATPAFCARVKKLLGGDPVAGVVDPGQGPASARPATSRSNRRGFRWWWVAPIFGMTMALALVLREGRKESVTPPATPAAAPVTEARRLANQAMQLLEDPNFTRETSWLADELCQRALALDAGDAEVWAVAALASNNLYGNTYDRSASRREKARSQAAKASQLDPQSIRAALASARCLEGTGNDGEVLRILRELHRRAPSDQQVIFSLIEVEGRGGNEAAVQDLLRELRALPRTGVLPLTLWFRELRLRTAGRYAEAEEILNELLAAPEVLRGAYYEKLNLLMRSWHDLADAGAFIEKIPARFRQEPAFGSAIAYYHLWRREPELALRALDQVPQDYFEEYAAREPKALLTGWAHSLAGRSAAAQAEWRNALALVDERLKPDGRNFILLNQRVLLLALTGQSAAAREAWQLRVELGAEDRPAPEMEAQVLIALGDTDGALTALERGWYQLNPGVKGLNLPTLRYHPAFASLQGDPRLQRILADGAATLATLKGPPAGTPAVAAPAPDDKSVAVLAFANLSDDKANEYFSDGISEELLTVLQKIPGLKVSARTSAFSFKGKTATAQEIGRTLGVANLVEGSVRKAGSQVRISARLSRADTGEQLWSESYTRELKDVFSVQTELAQAIVVALRAKLLGGSGTEVRNEIASQVSTAQQGGTTHVEAHELYLQGKYFANQPSLANIDKAVDYFQRAVNADGSFALAWAALGRTVALQAEYFATTPQDLRERFARARRAVDRALALAPELADGYFARTEIQAAYDYDWVGARESTERTLILAPSNALVISNASQLEGQFGDLERSIRLGRQATELDPVNAEVRYWLGMVYKMAGRLSEAEAEFRRAAELSPAVLSVHRQQSVVLVLQGRAEAAVAEARVEESEWSRQAALAVACWAAKEIPGADAALERLIAVAADSAGYQVAEAYAFRGEADRAFEWLERAYVNRDSGMGWLRVDPLLKNLHGDPRWTAFVQRVGLSDEQLK